MNLSSSLLVWIALISVTTFPAQSKDSETKPPQIPLVESTKIIPSNRHSDTNPILTNLSLGEGRALTGYRNDIFKRISDNWNAKVDKQFPTILLTLDRQGRVLKAALYEPIGDEQLEKAALYAASITTFAPFPEWCTEEEMTFKINMSSVQALK